MSEIKYIKAPFDEATARSLRAGDSVRISGVILAARDAAHKRLCECLDQGLPLPCDLTGHVVYYVGPSPAKPGQAIGSAGPTTSGRMDAYTPRLLACGLRGMIGKGYRKPLVVEAMQQYGVAPQVKPIRGGTDGAQLSFKGLPCPNIFAGGVNFHGPFEFVSVQVMEKAMRVIVKICELTASYND